MSEVQLQRIHLETDTHKPYLFATLARNALVVCMCACAAWAAVALTQRLAPGAYTLVLLPMCVLVAMDALYIGQKNRHVGIFTKEWFLLNVSRWAIIIVTLKLTTYISRNLTDLLVELPEWRTNPLLFFWNIQFVLSLFVVLIIWGMGRVLGGDLAHLTEGERLMTIDPNLGTQTERPQVRQALVTHIFGMGVLIALIGGLANGSLGGVAGSFPVGVNLVAYFAFGLALIGLSQLTVLRAGWLWERTPIGGNLIKRWALYGLVFIGVLALVALILPVSYSEGLLPVLSSFIRLLASGAQLIGYFLYALLGALLLPFAWLFSGLRPGSLAPPQPFIPPPLPPQPEEPLVEMPPWFQQAQSVIFWAIVLILLGYAVRYFLLQHQGVRQALRELPILIWLRSGWRGLLDLLRGLTVEITELRQAARERKPWPLPAVQPPEPRLDVKGLPLREQVRLIYLDMLKRVGEQGVVRRSSQTPYEFAQALTAAAPDAQPEIDQVTQQFVEARYSTHDATVEHVSVVRRCAQRVMHSLARTLSR